jgi:hypothetical protein
MSEYELSLMRQRGRAARDSKARRGEFQFMLPPGFCWSETGKIEIDPDEHVQEAIRMVFAKFRELGRAFNRSRSRPAEIVIDDLDGSESCRAGSAGQIVLPALAFEIADDLPKRRLPHIDDRHAAEVVSRDFGAHDRLPALPPRPPAVRRWLRAAGRLMLRSAPLRSGSLGTASGSGVRDRARAAFGPDFFSCARIASFVSKGRNRELRLPDLPLSANMAASLFNASMLTCGGPRLMPAQ